MDRIKNLLGGVGTNIVALVSVIWNFVDAVLELIRSVSDFVTKGLVDILSWIGNFGWRAYHGVLGLEDWAGRFAHDIIHSIAETGKNAIDTAWHYAEDVSRALHGALDSSVSVLRDNVKDVYGWTIKNVLDPLGGRIVGLTTWATTFASDTVHAIEDRLQQAKDFASGLVHSVADPFWNVWSSMRDEWIPLFKRVKDWLVFLAEHPFDWWIILLRNVASSASGSVADWALRALTQNGDKVEEAIAKWLGA